MASKGTIILVPGFCGSELYLPASFGSFGRIWCNHAALLAGAWRLLEYPGAVTLQPGGPLPDYYWEFRKMLDLRGWRVVPAVLDWRQSIVSNGSRLFTAVLAESREAPVHLVGHSRGGLVIRAALWQMALAGQLERVGRCVGLCVPHQGSLAAPSLLAGWQTEKVLLYRLLLVTQSLLVGGIPRVALNQMISSWPALYELFPAPGNSWLPAAQTEQLRDPATWTAVGAPFSAALLEAGGDAWQSIPEAPDAVDWLDLVGTGYETPLSVVAISSIDGPDSMAWGLTGDGTVAAVAARQLSHPHRVRRMSHDGALRDGRAVLAIDAFLSDGTLPLE